MEVNSNGYLRNEKEFLYHAQERPSVRRGNQPVSEGITVDNKTEITNGISAGDMIVVKGQSLLNDGSAVNIVSVSE